MYWAMKKKPLPITGTGEETRDFTFVMDIVQALLTMAYHDEATGDAFNIGAGTETRIVDLAQSVNEITGNTAGIVFAERRDWDKKSRLLSSIEKARRVLKYQPRTDFKEGLVSVHAWFSDQWQNIVKSTDL